LFALNLHLCCCYPSSSLSSQALDLQAFLNGGDGSKDQSVYLISSAKASKLPDPSSPCLEHLAPLEQPEALEQQEEVVVPHLAESHHLGPSCQYALFFKAYSKMNVVL